MLLTEMMMVVLMIVMMMVAVVVMLQRLLREGKRNVTKRDGQQRVGWKCEQLQLQLQHSE